MASVIKTKEKKVKNDGRPSVLVVDDEKSLVELVDDVIGREVNCRVVSASTIKQARKIMASQQIDVLVADIGLPDGDGMSLVPSLREQQPAASVIVMTGSPSVEGAVEALRLGAVDFVSKPFSAEQITERVRKGIERHAAAVKVEKRLDRLRDAVKRLSAARKVVSKKVDLLCNDLVSAYGELSRQFDVVRVQEGFRSVLATAKDMEQVLCHAMDWMLREIGYSNVAIWLAADEQEFQLGAYMKYTVPGEPPLITAMKSGLLAMTQREGVVRLSGEEADDRLTPAELEYMSDSTVLAINCTYLSEPLATVILFRDGAKPFTEEDEETLRTVAPIFACSLAAIVREALPGEEEAEGEEMIDREEEGKEKKADADWWKRGESPPF